jgi:hypothetical protein
MGRLIIAVALLGAMGVTVPALADDQEAAGSVTAPSGSASS